MVSQNLEPSYKKDKFTAILLSIVSESYPLIYFGF